MAWLGGILGFIALALGLFGFGQPLDRKHPIKIVQAVMLVIWIIGPSIWFWYECFYLYKRTQNQNRDWDGFKYGQDQSAKIWLALVTVLFGLYFGKDFIRETSKPQPSPCPSVVIQQVQPPTSQPNVSEKGKNTDKQTTRAKKRKS